MQKEVKSYKLKVLPNNPIPNAILYVKSDIDTEVSMYITDFNGVPYPLKDEATGTGGIQTISNSDGTVSVLGTNNTVLNLSTSIKNIINSALQPGGNISELVNDENYITLADIPSQIVDLQATPSATNVVIENTAGTDATILAATTTNAGVLLPADKIKLNNITGVNSGDQTSITGITGTKSEYNTSLTDGDFLFVGDVDKTTVGLSNVDNTSDLSKPVSTATQTALDLKANDNNVVHLSGTETITGEKTIKNKLYFRNAANDLFLTIPELSTSYSAENTVLGVTAGGNIIPIQFTSPTYGVVTGGTANTILGKSAGFTLNSGNENTLIGHNAGYSLFLPVGNDPMFDSSLNTFIGSNSGYNVTTGYANCFMGQKSGNNATSGSHNIIIGKSAGGDGTHLNGILNGNVIIGSGAAKESPFSQYNVILGVDAGYDSNGQANVFLGNNAGSGTNINNTFIAGSSSYPISNVYFGKGYQNSTPTNYTINGTRGVGSEITGGNITIAGGTGTGLALGGDVIVQTSTPISAGTQAHFLSEAFRVKASTGRIGVNTTSPSEKLEVVGNIKATSFIKSGGLSTEFLKADGSVSTIANPISGTGTANLLTKWATSSTQTNSIVQDDGTTVGVGTGTLSSGQKFMVFGNQSNTGSLTINNDGATISGFNTAGSTQSGFLTFNSGAGVSLASSNTAPVKFFVNGTEIIRLTGGNTLIGSTSNTGEKLQVTGTAKITGITTFTVSPIISSETASTIASFDGTKNIKSLDTSTYPNLTELSYAKGVTSAIQTQFTGKQATITAGTTSQYYRGDKSMQDLNPAVIGSVLTGFSEGVGTVASTDTVLQGFNKLAGNQVFKGTYSTTATAQTSFTVTIGRTMANTNYVASPVPLNTLSTVVFSVQNKTTTTFDIVVLAGLTGAVSYDFTITP